MDKPTCHTCVFSYWDKGLWLRIFGLGMPLRAFCANQPDAPGHERETPSGRVCRNYRLRPATPDLADGTVKRIPITGGLYAYVDAADYEEINRHHWRLVGGGYAGRYGKGKCILMHRQIMNPPEGMVVDHLSGNRLDNTRDNLRVSTRQQNARNQGKHRGARSHFKGVGYSKQHERWFARIYFEGRQVWLGLFDDEVEAAHAYDRKAAELFGEFAHLNFPDEWPPQRRAEVYALRRATGVERRSQQSKRKTQNASRRTERKAGGGRP